MAKFKKIYGNNAGETPSSGRDLVDNFNENFELVSETLDTITKDVKNKANQVDLELSEKSTYKDLYPYIRTENISIIKFVKSLYLYSDTYTDFSISLIRNNVISYEQPYSIRISARKDGIETRVSAWFSTVPQSTVVFYPIENCDIIGCGIFDWNSLDKEGVEYVTQYSIGNAAFEKGSQAYNFFINNFFNVFSIEGYSIHQKGNIVANISSVMTPLFKVPDDRRIICRNIYPFIDSFHIGAMFYDKNGVSIPTTYTNNLAILTLIAPENAVFYRLASNKKYFPSIINRVDSRYADDFINENNHHNELINNGVFSYKLLYRNNKPVNPLFLMPNQKVDKESGAFVSSSSTNIIPVICHDANTITYPNVKSSIANIFFFDRNYMYLGANTNNTLQDGEANTVEVLENAYFAFILNRIGTNFDFYILNKNDYLSKTIETVEYPVSKFPLGSLSHKTVLIDIDVDLQKKEVVLDNVTIKFKEEKIIKNGILSGTYYFHVNDNQRIFDYAVNPDWGTTETIYPICSLHLSGNCLNEYLSVKWWGASGLSPYLKNSNQSQLYDKGSDDTVYINWAIYQANQLGGGKVYIPTGCYYVRCQVPVEYQDRVFRGRYVNSVLMGVGLSKATADECAIWMYDNVTLYGNGNLTKLVLVNYMTADDFNITIPKYWCRVMIGWAKREADEFVEADKAYWNTYNTVTLKRMKLGRNNAIVKDLYIDMRTYHDSKCSLDTNVSTEIGSFAGRIAIYFTFQGYTTSDNSYINARRTRGSKIIGVNVYDSSMHSSFSSRGEWNGLEDCEIYNCNAEFGFNKAFEIFGSKNCIIRNSFVKNYKCGFQLIAGSENCLIENCYCEDVAEGINVTTKGINNLILGNNIKATGIAMRLRNDDDMSQDTLEDSLTIRNNYFEQSDFQQSLGFLPMHTKGSVKGALVFTGSGHSIEDLSFKKTYKNLLFDNNRFSGKKAYIGVHPDNLLASEKISVTLEGVKFSNNKWEVNELYISQFDSSTINRPKSVIRRLKFEDFIPDTLKIYIQWGIDDITFFNLENNGVLNFSSDYIKTIIMSQCRLLGNIVIPTGYIYLLDNFIVSPLNIGDKANVLVERNLN